MDKFEIDDVVIIIWIKEPEWIGAEVTIQSALYQRTGSFVHDVAFSDGDYAHMEPKYLRKKRPPTESLDIQETRKRPASTWAEIKQDCEKEKEHEYS